MQIFDQIYKGKRVLILGHTGFKGSWLTIWLNKLGAEVFGASLGVPTHPSHFESAQLKACCDSRFIDIRNYEQLASYFEEVKPDFVFHLAAQALVGSAYIHPQETFETNVLGTINILQCLRAAASPICAVLVTSDKAYENVEMVHGYRESDRLGGKDPYSASKGCAEIAIRSYIESFFSDETSLVQVGVGRAGNVIGGGDWSDGRLVPDAVRAWVATERLMIRSPAATRPWQHVLEPLSGYLHLGAAMSKGDVSQGEPFNFGPKAEDLATVGDIVKSLQESLDGLDVAFSSDSLSEQFNEAGLLKLCCDKALHVLGWSPVLGIEEALKMTADWYRAFGEQPDHSRSLSEFQIDQYCELAIDRGLPWVSR